MKTYFKKSILFFAVPLFVFASCKEQATVGYTIDGTIAGTEGKVYLTVFEGKMPSRIDSAEVVNGTFSFKGTRDIPILAAIETPDAPVVRFFLENSPIVISGNLDDADHITISGSVTEDTYRKYRAHIDSVENAFFSDSVALSNEQVADSLEKVIDGMRMQFVEANPGSVAAAYVLYRELSYGMGYEDLYKAVEKFTPEVRKSVYVDMVNSMAGALKKTAVGQHYTDFSVPDKDGNPVALSSVVGEGKYVLLDFWASWCPPCRAESPNMVAAYKEYAPKGFEIFAVSLDKNKEAWLKGIEQLNLGWKHASELKFWESQPAEIYGVRSIPSNILIGPDGTIIARNLMGEDLQNKLAELLNAKP